MENDLNNTQPPVAPRPFQGIERKVPLRAIQSFFRSNYRNHINLSAIADNKATANLLLALWPLYAATFAVVVSFWMGEWREKRLLVKHGVLAA